MNGEKEKGCQNLKKNRPRRPCLLCVRACVLSGRRPLTRRVLSPISYSPPFIHSPSGVRSGALVHTRNIITIPFCVISDSSNKYIIPSLNPLRTFLTLWSQRSAISERILLLTSFPLFKHVDRPRVPTELCRRIGSILNCIDG